MPFAQEGVGGTVPPDWKADMINEWCRFRGLARRRLHSVALMVGVIWAWGLILAATILGDDESAVLTTRDIERLLKIPRQTQVDLLHAGGFSPHFFAGHKVLYRKDAALAWITEQERIAASAATGDDLVADQVTAEDQNTVESPSPAGRRLQEPPTPSAYSVCQPCRGFERNPSNEKTSDKKDIANGHRR
jgi:hypothetical protein